MNEWTEFLIKNYDSLSARELEVLLQKCPTSDLVKNYKIPIDLIKKLTFKIDLDDLLCYQHLTIDEIINIFSIYNFKQFEHNLYLLGIYQYNLINDELINKLKFLNNLKSED